MARRTDQVKTDGSRAEDLISEAIAFCEVHDEWANDKNPARDYPDEIYFAALKSLRDVFENGDVPHRCRALVAAVSLLAEQDDIYANRENASNRDFHPEFLRCREAVAAELATIKQRQFLIDNRGSVRDLFKQNVPPLQIAKIWGLKDRYGQFKERMAFQEKENPGCIIGEPGSLRGVVGAMDGETWVDPAADGLDGEDAPIRLPAGRKSTPAAVEPQSTKSPEDRARAVWEENRAIVAAGRSPIPGSQLAKMAELDQNQVAEFFQRFDEEYEASLEPESEEAAETPLAPVLHGPMGLDHEDDEPTETPPPAPKRGRKPASQAAS